MAGKKRHHGNDDPRPFRDAPPPHMNDGRGFRDGPPPPIRVRVPLPHPVAMEEELEIQHDEIRRLLGENRLLAEDHMALQHELAIAKDELHGLSQVIPKLRAEKDGQARELIEKGLKLEADLRAAEPLKADVLQLRAEAQKVAAARQEMTAQIQALTQDLARMQAENQQIPAMKADMDALRQELVRARTAFEYETKASVELREQRQAMEKNLASMAREVETLRSERISLEKRGWGSGQGGYGMLKGSPEIGYAGAFGDGYGAEKGLYGAEKGLYGAEKGLYGSGSLAAYEKRILPRR